MMTLQCKKCKIMVMGTGSHPCWHDLGVCPKCFDYSVRVKTNYTPDESNMIRVYTANDLCMHLGTLRQMYIDSDKTPFVWHA